MKKSGVLLVLHLVRLIFQRVSFLFSAFANCIGTFFGSVSRLFRYGSSDVAAKFVGIVLSCVRSHFPLFANGIRLPFHGIGFLFHCFIVGFLLLGLT